MDNKQEKLIVIIKEGAIASVVKDVFTFGMFAGLMYFNHAFLDGNGWIDAIFILFVFMFLAGRASSKVFSGSPAKAIEWLEAERAIT